MWFPDVISYLSLWASSHQPPPLCSVRQCLGYTSKMTTQSHNIDLSGVFQDTSWPNYETSNPVVYPYASSPREEESLQAVMGSSSANRSVIGTATRKGTGTGTARVCEKCVIKKRKCNRQRPTCSRCLEDKVACVYTSAKRKPGPAKGFKKAKSCAEQQLDSTPSDGLAATDFATKSNGVGASKESSRQTTAAHDHTCSPSNASSSSSTQLPDHVPRTLSLHSDIMETLSSYPTSFISSSAPQGVDQLSSLCAQLAPEQAHQMLEDFFNHVHPSICLFDKHKIMSQDKHGTLDGYLRVTILSITSHIQGYSVLWTHASLKSCLDQLLAIDCFEVDHISGSVALSRFQQAVLLAFYAFHQYPGRKSWLRVSELAREAYAWGLHQIDNPNQCSVYANNSDMNFEEREDWRRLWWSIYCLDAYCSMTVQSPSVVELDVVRTALISSGEELPPQEALFLPANTDRLWELCQAVLLRPRDSSINMHILTTTLLRQAGKLIRRWAQDPTPETDIDFLILDDHLSAVRLALPPKFSDVSRDIVQNESPEQHHARLICNLHLCSARLLVTSPRTLSGSEEYWRRGWAANLECCEDVVLIAKQWKARLCPSVDPAVCIIIVSVLMFLHLHSIDIMNTESVAFLARVHGQKEILRLLLEQFASIWHLPRFLIESYQKFTTMFSGPITSTDIAAVMSQLGGAQLNRNWLRLLSLNSDHLEPPKEDGLDMSGIPEVDLRDWEL
ncbi:hypothetical protein VTL71DRAFT_3174 [Oculimacula yallundae]|uniref:Zn(2)-C6 fungal-type domain-containing protein n=1 Tax=Oculimacula yallundae TaxID=86028 RepID=A0ABR4C6F9_9HELO